jgi:glycosyltransferase involved in cell wall biosynthesis
VQRSDLPPSRLREVREPLGEYVARELRDRQPRISCVVPCRNEADNLEQLLPLLTDTLDSIAAEWELILVDDGSTDRTPVVMAAWARQRGIRVLQLSRNFGKEAALTAGLQASRGDVVVMMDADLQHPPALLPQLLARWRDGADVVYAVRTHRRDETAFKRLGARWFYALINAADRFTVPPDAGDFRLMDRAAVDALLALPERNRFMKGLYAWVGFDAVALPYEPPPRASGRSHFGIWRLMRLSLDGLTAFTTWPLRAVSVLGFALALPGFIYGCYLSIEYLLFGNPVSGWTTIVVLLLFLLGVQMVSLGVVGEYIGRIFEEVKGRPLFIVRREMGRGLDERAP